MSMTDRKSMVQPCHKHTKNGALRGCHRTNGLDKKASINKLKVDLCWFKWWDYFWQLERSACSSFQHHQNNFKQSYSRWFVGDTLARNRKNISLQNVESQLSKLWQSMPSILVFGHIHPSIHPSVRPSVRPSIYPSIHSSHQHGSTPTSSVLSQDDKAPVKHSIESKRWCWLTLLLPCCLVCCSWHLWCKSLSFLVTTHLYAFCNHMN